MFPDEAYRNQSDYVIGVRSGEAYLWQQRCDQGLTIKRSWIAYVQGPSQAKAEEQSQPVFMIWYQESLQRPELMAEDQRTVAWNEREENKLDSRISDKNCQKVKRGQNKEWQRSLEGI